MSTSLILSKHKVEILSTAGLLVAGLPLFFFSPSGYLAFLSIILLRGVFFYGIVSHLITEEVEECMTQVLGSNTLRNAVLERIENNCDEREEEQII